MVPPRGRNNVHVTRREATNTMKEGEKRYSILNRARAWHGILNEPRSTAMFSLQQQGKEMSEVELGGVMTSEVERETACLWASGRPTEPYGHRRQEIYHIGGAEMSPVCWCISAPLLSASLLQSGEEHLLGERYQPSMGQFSTDEQDGVFSSNNLGQHSILGRSNQGFSVLRMKWGPCFCFLVSSHLIWLTLPGEVRELRGWRGKVLKYPANPKKTCTPDDTYRGWWSSDSPSSDGRTWCWHWPLAVLKVVLGLLSGECATLTALCQIQLVYEVSHLWEGVAVKLGNAVALLEIIACFEAAIGPVYYDGCHLPPQYPDGRP